MEVVKPPRVFVAGLFHETNTFVEKPTTRADFTIRRGREIFGSRGDDSPLDGFLEAAGGYGWEVVPGVDYRANPSGPVADEIFEAFWEDLWPRLETALAEGLAAIFLVLHGAMVTPSHPDVEGELLARLRAIPGVGRRPIFAVLDLHANVSERMARHASALIPYRENPHIDARQTAVRAARLLWDALTTGTELRTHYRHARVLLAPPDTGSAGPLMRELLAMARGLERSGGFREIGIAAGFAHADCPDAGLTFWVVSERPEILCANALQTLSALARSLAREATGEVWEVAAALDVIAAERRFPALLVEPADNIGGGAPGDGTTLLRSLLERSIGRSGVILNDPEAVGALRQVEPGQSLTLALGGKGSSLDPGPVDVDVTLERLTDGRFELEDKQSHLASMVGRFVDMGPCALVRHRHVWILLTSKPTPPFDLGQWRSQGVDPAELDIIAVKAAVAHRRAYDPIAGSSFTVTTPGPCSSDLRALPYRKLRRPIHPVDA